VKKVIDAGALRSPELFAFLSSSARNIAVLTDYASMESFKGNAAINIRKSVEIVSRFPEQVLVLKSTREITQLRPRNKGLLQRFVDQKQCEKFKHYCSALATGGDDVAYDVGLKETNAKDHFDKLLGSAETIRTGITLLAKSLTPLELNALRTRKPVPESFTDKTVKNILHVTALHFRDAAGMRSMPSVQDAFYSFPFRYALCSYALSLKWIADGGHETAAAEKIRNDFTDMTYAAYATFFDGLISKDKKLYEIHLLAEWMLSSIFHLNNREFQT
jgi:hypothetical protein